MAEKIRFGSMSLCSCFLKYLPRRISISGPDGVGKSTQIKYLKCYLSKKCNMKVKVVWIRNTHTFSYLIVKFCETLGIGNILVKTKGGTIITNRLAISKMWHIFEIFSVLIKSFVGVTLPIIFGYVVVTDRYFLDTVVGTIIASNKIPKLMIRILIPFSLKNGENILLKAKIKTIIERCGILSDPPKFLYKQKKLYNVLSRSLKIKVISVDNKNSIRIFNELLKLLCPYT